MTRPTDITDRTAACAAGGGEPVLGNYFVAAYPPFSAWSAASNPALHEALDQGQGAPPAPLGIYVHVPFCQKKCDYCYYLSYIAQPAPVVNRYLDTVLAEGALYASRPAVEGRPPAFVYFGGGTPSMLGQAQVRHRGVHYQNATTIEDYETPVAGGNLPLGRAFKLAAEDRLVREFILQLKLGVVQLAPLRTRFGVDPLEVFAAPLRAFAADGWLVCSDKSVQLTRAGLLRVDRLLPQFYAPSHQSIRYT